MRLPALIGLSHALDMILTGRPVDATEALKIGKVQAKCNFIGRHSVEWLSTHTGLANRVVAEGKSLEEALKLAHQLAQFPQKCLRADRNSALRSSSAKQFKDLLSLEVKEGVKVVREEAIQGAQRFTKGEGRGGKFE